MERLSVSLDDEHAEKLARLADRLHLRARLGLGQATAGKTVFREEL
jgi:predicted transcriptional regulator